MTSFYEENEISDLLICYFCKEKFKDPRCLPCSESICSSCVAVKAFKSSNKNTLYCIICKGMHEIPAGGFPPNKVLIKLLEKKSSEIYRGHTAECLKQTISDLLLRSKVLETGRESREELIREHCGLIRSELKSAIDSKRADISHIYDKYLLEIESYEQDSLKGSGMLSGGASDNSTGATLMRTAQEVQSFCFKWTNYLKQPMLNENELAIALDIAEHFAAKLETEREQKKKATFNGKILCFKKNFNKIQPKMVGMIDIKSDQAKAAHTCYVQTYLEEEDDPFGNYINQK